MTFLRALPYLAALALLPAANAQPAPAACGSDPACVLDALWPGEIAAKPHEIRALQRAFVGAAAQSGDTALVHVWSERTGALPPQDDNSFVDERATAALAALSPQALRKAAQDRAEPYFGLARVDIMLAVWRLTDDAWLRDAIVADLRMMSGSVSANGDWRDDWEAKAAGSALAEIGLWRCDAALVNEGARASGFTSDIRYRIWAAHAAGELPDPAAIRAETGGDIDKVRTAVEAWGETWANGPCG